MPTLHLICGLPGAGKSTLAKSIEAASDTLRLAPDEWMHGLGADAYDEAAREKVEALQWRLAQRLLSLGVNVVLENGFWSRSEREAYRRVAGALGAETRLHYLDVPIDELKRRVERRNQTQTDDAFFVDPNDIDAWSASFEAPTRDEIERT